MVTDPEASLLTSYPSASLAHLRPIYAVQPEEPSEAGSKFDTYSDSDIEAYDPKYAVPELKDSEQSELLDDRTRDTRRVLLKAMRARRVKLAKQRKRNDIQAAQLKKSLELQKHEAREDECVLLRELNTHTLVARLPDEVLGLVFQTYANEARGTFLDACKALFAVSKRRRSRSPSLSYKQALWQEDNGPYIWFKVLQVSHHWRDIALHTPRIWTWILTYPLYGRNPTKLARLGLSCSKSCPLTLYAQYDGRLDPSLFGLISRVKPKTLAVPEEEPGDWLHAGSRPRTTVG